MSGGSEDGSKRGREIAEAARESRQSGRPKCVKAAETETTHKV